jgi:hypothetical protein
MARAVGRIVAGPDVDKKKRGVYNATRKRIIMGDRPKQIDTKRPSRVTTELSLVKPTRLGQRRLLAETWLLEEENSRYRYNVETCRNGRKVYLQRPTWLNKGFDFEIRLEGFPSRYERPSHSNIIEDLREKKAESLPSFRRLRELIDGVYGCGEPDQFLLKYPNLSFRVGLPVDAVLKVLKWMFIEQDLTYWNGRGRRMLMEDGIQTLD